MKKTMVIFLSLLLLSTMFGCSTINSPTAQGHTSSYQSSSGSTENETSKQNSSVMSVASESSETATASLLEENSGSSSSSVTWVCPNPNAHYGTCTNQESHNRLVAALAEARNQASSATTSSTASVTPVQEIHQTVQYNNETVSVTILTRTCLDGTIQYYEPNPWRGPNSERIKVDQNTGDASIYLCKRCGKPYGNGHNGTCLYIIGEGGCHNCDDTTKTCPFCGRHFGNGYNGTCYLTRAEGIDWNNCINKDLIYCYHYDEGIRYRSGKNPEPIN